MQDSLAHRQKLAAVATANENASVENRWCQLRDTVQSTALAVLGRARRQHQDWFDDNDAAISNLLDEKNHLHRAYPPEQPSRTESPTGKLVQLPPSSRNDGYELHRPPTSGEVPGDADPSGLYLCGSGEGLRHGESQRTVNILAEIRLSRAIHSDCASAPRWHDGASRGQWSSLRSIRSDQRSEAGLRSRARPPQSHELCHADGRLPWRTSWNPHRLVGGRSPPQPQANALPIARIHNHSSRTSIRQRRRPQHQLWGEDMQRIMDLFSAACDNFGLVINTEKTAVIHQPSPDAA
ncbi:hypothetical protein SprV_0301112800 [Sparganum proliferum]